MGTSLSTIEEKEEITFFLHGQPQTIKAKELTPTTTLNTYIRNTLHLTGTKGMCYEGGCGCCVVVLELIDPTTGKNVLLSVNSCLVPILSCAGAKIFTSEGIGNPENGYHPIQTTLATFNGTQCGFCSPGMVMNMYSLYKSGQCTMQEIENGFSGNICRCTGYRPILSAFKSLCKDASTDILGHCPDIEDFEFILKPSSLDCCDDLKSPFFCTLKDNGKWIKVYKMQELCSALRLYKNSTYRLIAGCTAQGVYPSYKNPVDLYIDITSIPELVTFKEQQNSFSLGGNITITNTINILEKTAQKNINFTYFTQLAKHLRLVANLPVQNKATLAGNLSIKHDHKEFASDIFLLLETVNAIITVLDAVTGRQIEIPPRDYINYDMNLKILTTISLPALSNSTKFVSYKIMARAQSVPATINAGFLFKFKPDQSLESATIVYGNINNTFVHASLAEKALIGKQLFNNQTLQSVFANLNLEVVSVEKPPNVSAQCRNKMAIALFYKAVLSIAPAEKINSRNKSGGLLLERPLSKGVQDFETQESLYPLTQAIPKIEALAQTSGQAQFINDMPDLPYQLYGALVLAKTRAGSIITKIDPSKALKIDSVVAFFDASSIPGDNNFTPLSVPFFSQPEEIFCSSKILYYDQPIGMLVGSKEDVLQKAIDAVEVSYNVSTEKPVLSVPQILKENKTSRITKDENVEPKRRGQDVKHIIKGTFNVYQQYHFYMETISCNVIPNENILEVYPTTQYMDLCQVGIAQMLKIKNNQIIVTVRRCGGAFGGKMSRTNLVACATALAAWKLHKPVKMTLSLKTNMRTIGKRFPLTSVYEVGVNDNGIIQYLDNTLYTDVGAIRNENSTFWLLDGCVSTYISDTFKFQVNKARTDTPTHTWMRAPGSAEGIANLENIMDHIAYTLKKDPLDIRVANIDTNSPLNQYVQDLKTWAELDKRKAAIENFNGKNRWRKMGLSVTPMCFYFNLLGPYFAFVTILHDDGTVQISHGGVEIGQGINTKAAQVCAYKLNIPLNYVNVIPSNTFTSSNSLATADNKTSEAVCYGIIQACDILLQRIKPIRDQLPSTATWKEIINKCHENFVNLTANGIYAPNQPNVTAYPIYGICATEVLVDILTGQHYITRTDLIEDTGRSISPLIDIGQIEGAYITGIGYYTTEKIVFDEEGQLLTDNTWTYLPPGAKDIPVDFRVKIPKNNPNPLEILKTKGAGEPPLCLAVSAALALRNAIASSRKDAGIESLWYSIDGPTDLESVFMHSSNDYSEYTL